MSRGKIWFFIISFLVTASILYVIWRPSGILSFNNPGDIANVAIEFHGMVFDIILFGVILTIYEFLTDRKQRIQRYKEEIDDFRGWTEKEAAYRIAGNIRRLNRENVNSINLHLCYLNETKLQEVNLNGANLSSAFLSKANLSKANLNRANLSSAIILEAYLFKADFSGADLSGARLMCAELFRVNLSGANLSGANLSGADLNGANFSRADLSGANLSEADFKNNNSISILQLKTVKSLYQCKNLDPEIEKQLRKEKPCLFSEDGCQ